MMLGASLVNQGKYAEAEPLLLSGHTGLVERRAKILPEQREPSINESIDNLVSLYEKWGQPEKAAEWRLKRQAPAAQSPAGATAGHWPTLRGIPILQSTWRSGSTDVRLDLGRTTSL